MKTVFSRRSKITSALVLSTLGVTILATVASAQSTNQDCVDKCIAAKGGATFGNAEDLGAECKQHCPVNSNNSAHSHASSNASGNSYNFLSGFGDVENAQPNSGIRNFGTLSEFIVAVLRVLTALIGIIAVAAILYGGFLYITSGGDEDKTGTAKKIIMYAVIGLVVIGIAGILVNVVINIIRAT